MASTIPAATAGLYGGTRDEGSCDVGRLTDFLTDPAHTDEAAAFAGVLGISTGAIAGTLAALAPVVLTVDTLVTNHGYSDGRATPFPAVLQAGTAVLVDTAGAPRVRCGCGNPLTRPPTDVDLDEVSGEAWDRFSPTTVVTVTPSAVPLDGLVLIDVETGDTYDRPFTAATAASTTTAPTTVPTPPPTAPPSTEPPASTPPTTTTTTTTAAAPSGSDLGDLPVLRDDQPSGSGCNPGPGALPDGWWFGFPSSPPQPEATFGFDLACFARTPTGNVDYEISNSVETERPVAVAAGAEPVCVSGWTLDLVVDCGDFAAVGYFVWVRVDGGVATRVLGVPPAG